MFRSKAARLFKTYEYELMTIVIGPSGSMKIIDKEKERQKAIEATKKGEKHNA